MSLNRSVETYAWVESSDTTTKDNVGGSSTSTTTYTYAADWVTTVQDLSKFKEPGGRENVASSYTNSSEVVDVMNVAGLNVETVGLRLPKADVNVTSEVELLTEDFVLEGGYLYNGFGSVTSPFIGDTRVTYTALPEMSTGTVFGEWNAERSVMDPYYADEIKIHGLYTGNKAQALETMHSEYMTKLWLVRGAALLFMFLGFNMIFAPFHTVLDVVPIFG